MHVKLEQIDLTTINDHGNRCGCCHCPIEPGCGVTFGRPCLAMPAINICRSCVNIATAVLGPTPTTFKEGNC